MTINTHITEKHKCQPAGGARGKVALGIILHQSHIHKTGNTGNVSR